MKLLANEIDTLQDEIKVSSGITRLSVFEKLVPLLYEIRCKYFQATANEYLQFALAENEKFHILNSTFHIALSHNFSESLSQLSSVSATAEREDFSEIKVLCQKEIALKHIKAGNFISANEILENSLNGHNDDKAKAEFLFAKALMLQYQYEYDLALKYIEDAIAICKENLLVTQEINCLLLRAAIFSTLRKTDLSNSDIDTAKNLAAAIGYSYALANCFLQEAKNHLIHREPDLAVASIAACKQQQNYFADEETEMKCLRLESKIMHLKGNIAASIALAENARKKCLHTNNKAELYYLLLELAARYDDAGEHFKALESYYEVLKIAGESREEKLKALPLFNIGAIYQRLGDTNRSLEHYKECLKFAEAYRNPAFMASLYRNLAVEYRKDGQLQEAWEFAVKRLSIYTEIDNNEGIADAKGLQAEILSAQNRYSEALSENDEALSIAHAQKLITQEIILLKLRGNICFSGADYKQSEAAFNKCLQLSKLTGFTREIPDCLIGLSNTLIQQGNFETAIAQLLEVEKSADEQQQSGIKIAAVQLLSIAYEKAGQSELALQNLKKSIELEKQQSDKETTRKLEALKYHQQIQQKEREAAIERERNEELNKAYSQLNQAHENLKTAQERLISQEKLASLGRLTAGIAHEIQNPLNFVNNFSDLSAELLDEMPADLPEEAAFIVDDLKGNLKKIHEYGKRASGIVKAMLEMSKATEGKPLSANLNKIIEQQWQVAYSNARSSYLNSRECFFEFNSCDLPDINLVPANMARVLSNIFDNALYSVAEVTELGFSPAIKATTKVLNNAVLIEIEDNGIGIDASVSDKIFEPFFTTKPTGKGNTGLGLSLCNDIIRSMGGTIHYTPAQQAGSIFTCTLSLE